MHKVLVARPDRIGDVVLSTPVFEALKRHLPGVEVHALVRDAVVPVVRGNPHLSKVLVYQPESAHRGLRGVLRLAREIRNERYDAAVTLHARLSVTLALWLARVPLRVGPRSKWFSYLFFNRGIRQNRSAVAMHEADYGLDLLRALGITAPVRGFQTFVAVDGDALERMRGFVSRLGIAEPFVLVHPGMGGSALNWPEHHYANLVRRLADLKVPVVVGGAPLEKDLVERVAEAARESKKATHEQLSDYIALLSLAQVVVAPSTGPLHLAVALGRSTVSFYPSIRVQSAARWGPYVREVNAMNHIVLGQGVSVDEAVESVLKQLGRSAHGQIYDEPRPH